MNKPHRYKVFTVFDHIFDGKSPDHSRKFFHAVTLMLVKRMSIDFKCYGRICMTEYFTQGFNIETKLQSTDTEGMPHRVRIGISHPGVFQ